MSTDRNMIVDSELFSEIITDFDKKIGDVEDTLNSISTIMNKIDGENDTWKSDTARSIHEKYTELGESMAYQTIDALKKYGVYRKIDEYGDGLDEEAIEHIISGFKHALVSLVDVGNPDGGVKGLGIKSAI